MKKRAQSYTDFHHAARAVLRKATRVQDARVKRARSIDSQSKVTTTSEGDINNDLDFADWYQDLEEALLESSLGGYSYGEIVALLRKLCS